MNADDRNVQADGAEIKIRTDERTGMPTALIIEQGGRITQDLVQRIRDFVKDALAVEREKRKGAVSATFGCSKCGKDVVVAEVTCPECVVRPVGIPTGVEVLKLLEKQLAEGVHQSLQSLTEWRETIEANMERWRGP